MTVWEWPSMMKSMPDLSDPNKMMSPDDIAALFANMGGDSAPAAEPVVEPEPIVEPEPMPEPVVKRSRRCRICLIRTNP